MTDTMTEEQYAFYLAYGYTTDAQVYENWDVFTSEDTTVVVE